MRETNPPHELPLKQMILPLVVFDMTPILKRDPNHALTVDDITAWERAHGRVPAGVFVALRTDMYKDWETNPERFKRSPFPAWSLEAIRFLYEQRGIVANGHESMNTDITDDLKSETWLLTHGLILTIRSGPLRCLHLAHHFSVSCPVIALR